jgi:hypothetical protein
MKVKWQHRTNFHGTLHDATSLLFVNTSQAFYIMFHRIIRSDSEIILVAPVSRASSLKIFASAGTNREILVIKILVPYGYTGSILKWLHVGCNEKAVRCTCHE